MSTAMMRSAPACFAPWITLRPTPPQPMTATLSPRRMLAVFAAAPKPVSTPQPMSAPAVSGISGSILTAPMAGMTASSANVPDAAMTEIGVPSRENREVMSRRPPLIDGHAADLAQLALVVLAEVARAALGNPRHHDVVADAEVVDAFAELDDRPGAFVAEHRRQRDRQHAVRDREVRVADAGRAHLDADLTGLGRRDVDVDDLER